MVRNTVSAFAFSVAFLLLLPPPARAAELLEIPGTPGISVTHVKSSGESPFLLEIGDVLTIDLVLQNFARNDFFGLGLVAAGHDPDMNGIADNGLIFLGGHGAPSVFGTVAVPGPPPNTFGGLDNIREESGPVQLGFFRRFDRFQTSFDPLRVALLDAISLAPANGEGLIDLGIGGKRISEGDAHLRVQYQAVAGLDIPTKITLEFGTLAQFGAVAVGAGGVQLAFQNDTFEFTVVPEPTTVLLISLGLMGLAASERRAGEATPLSRRNRYR